MGRVMGVLGVPMLIAPILGPILGGWLVDDVSWRWIFFINVPIGIVAFVLARSCSSPISPSPPTAWTGSGMLLLSPGLALLIFGPGRVLDLRLRRAALVGAGGRRSGC